VDKESFNRLHAKVEAQDAVLEDYAEQLRALWQLNRAIIQHIGGGTENADILDFRPSKNIDDSD
jgi:hypothetical protein